jgi:hypothetical protein
MQLPGNNDNNRAHRQGSRAFVVVVSAESVTVENSAISEREEFPDTSGRIPSAEEEILGAAFVGQGLFLCNDGSDIPGNDKRVYRKPYGIIR